MGWTRFNCAVDAACVMGSACVTRAHTLGTRRHKCNADPPLYSRSRCTLCDRSRFATRLPLRLTSVRAHYMSHTTQHAHMSIQRTELTTHGEPRNTQDAACDAPNSHCAVLCLHSCRFVSHMLLCVPPPPFTFPQFCSSCFLACLGRPSNTPSACVPSVVPFPHG